MKRRSFIASLVQTVAAAAVAARLVREEEIMPVQATGFDPLAYEGNWVWINVSNEDHRNPFHPSYAGPPTTVRVEDLSAEVRRMLIPKKV